jgi:Flp pilus assembly protein CpaB
MLAMTDSQAEKFWWVAQNGEWTLSLRPVTDAADSPERLENSVTVALDGVSARERKRVVSGGH